MERQNTKTPTHDAEYIEPKPKPRYVDPRPFAALGIVFIAALFVAALVIAQGVW